MLIALQEFCRRYSALRLIFGSGFPDNASGAAMLALAQAEIADRDKEKTRLMHRICWRRRSAFHAPDF